MIILPFKKTAPADIQRHLKDHIQANHPDTHPDAFKYDIEEWERYREAYEHTIAGQIHASHQENILKYHAQLVFILTKLPSDIGLQILYYPAFENSPSLSLTSILYERCCVLYNFAALCTQLANMENRSNVAGIKQATTYYQNAAGAVSHLRTTAAPPLLSSLDDTSKSMLPIELTEGFLKGAEHLMLAQAQECAWQLASLGTQYKNAVLARVSKTVFSLYFSSLPHFQHLYPRPPFYPLIELQSFHFDAVSQYRKSDDDHANHRYGDEVTRLNVALRIAQQAIKHAKAYRLPYATGENFAQTLKENLARSTKDNDYIYNQTPPTESKLPEIADFMMVRPIVADGLGDAKNALRGSKVILEDLMGWGASVAIDLYQDRKETWIREEIITPLKSIQNHSTKTLKSLGLPSSLEALSTPIGLPPSLLRKADEVRSDEGPERLRIMSENIQTLAEKDNTLLNESLDLLDQEASEDESFRTINPTIAAKISRMYPKSHEVNQHLTGKAMRYRETLEQAAESDDVVRKKLDENEDHIALLSLDEEDIETIVPSSTGSPAASKVITAHVRKIRSLLEQLSETEQTSTSILSRVDYLSRTDNISPRIMREASGIEMWTTVEPAMFEGVLEEEMTKYEKYKLEVEELEGSVKDLLDRVKKANDEFLATRKDDSSVKAREKMLQKLDLAYHKYKELLSNLEEGLKFYNDLGNILNAFKEECKSWVYERRGSARSLTESLDSLSLEDQKHNATQPRHPEPETSKAAESIRPSQPSILEAPYPVSARQETERPKSKPKTKSGLPPPSLNSDAWEPLSFPNTPNHALQSSISQTKTKKSQEMRKLAEND